MTRPAINALDVYRHERNIGTGSPAILLLDAWADHVGQAFDAQVYLVGSAATSKECRDVDLVLMLDDDKFDALFGANHEGFGMPESRCNRRWSAMCTAFSLWCAAATGLPVDFKFQRLTNANARHDGRRQPLGIYPTPQPWQEEDK